jgi:putative transposase
MRKSKPACFPQVGRFYKSNKLEALAKWDAGAKIDDLCREYQISTATLYNWKKEKATEEDDALRELKQLKQENARLKKMYANLSMDHEILQEGYEMLKKWQAQDAKNTCLLPQVGRND